MYDVRNMRHLFSFKHWEIAFLSHLCVLLALMKWLLVVQILETVTNTAITESAILLYLLSCCLQTEILKSHWPSQAMGRKLRCSTHMPQSKQHRETTSSQRLLQKREETSRVDFQCSEVRSLKVSWPERKGTTKQRKVAEEILQNTFNSGFSD